MDNPLEVKGKTVLGVFAHPDDLDVWCGGTMCSFINAGAKGFCLVLTDGSKGSEDTNLTSEELRDARRAEQQEAADILGLEDVFFLDYVDGELENSLSLRKDIVRIIRQVKPNIIITCDPTYFYDETSNTINHPDHRTAGLAALDATFPFSRNSRTFPELLEEGQRPHVVEEVLLINHRQCDFFIDISDVFDKKMEAVSKHESQFSDLEKTRERFTQRAKNFAEKTTGSKYAEGFVRISLKRD